MILQAHDFNDAINLAHRGSRIPVAELQAGVKALMQKELAPKVRLVSIPLTGHQGSVHTLAWNSEGTILASVSDDTKRMWGQNKDGSWQKIWLFGHNESHFILTAWSPNKQQYAYCSYGIIRIWTHRDDGSRFNESLANHEAASVVAWSPDGKNLASGSVNGTVNIWPMFESQNLSLEQLLAILGAHKAKERGANYARQVLGFLPTAFPTQAEHLSDPNLENGLKQLLNGLIPANSSCLIQ